MAPQNLSIEICRDQSSLLPMYCIQVVWSHSGFTAHAALGAEDSRTGLSESSKLINQILVPSVCYLKLLMLSPQHFASSASLSAC